LGHKKSKKIKIFELSIKITDTMMLKIKRSKSPTLGGTVDHFANQFQGPKRKEKKRGFEI
jgi:hypothetical protein